MESEHELITINNKKIFICEHHHHVLKFWYEFKELNPYLLTFDHHTDLHRAFQKYLGVSKYATQEEWDIAQNELVKGIASNDSGTLQKLTHAEHIDAAIKAGFIKKALIYSYDSYMSKPHRVYHINGNSSYNNQLIINNASYEGEVLSIDTCELEQNFKRFDLCLPREEWLDNFILDIDLDFFMTTKSITPADTSFFKMLITKSIAISIAKESVFVQDWQREKDNSLTVEYLMQELLLLVSGA